MLRPVVRLFSTSVRGRIYARRYLQSHCHPRSMFRPSTSAWRPLNTSAPRAIAVKDTSSNGDTPQTKTATESEKVAMLEATAKAPWLSSLSDSIDDRLKVAYLIVFQLVLYLDRPMELEATTQFFTALETAPVSPGSDMGRARTAIVGITRGVVHQISSIPAHAPLRKEKREIFDVFSALQALNDAYLPGNTADLDFRQWSEFWSRALPVVLELAYQLDQKGYGLTKEDLGELYRQEKQDNEPT